MHVEMVLLPKGFRAVRTWERLQVVRRVDVQDMSSENGTIPENKIDTYLFTPLLKEKSRFSTHLNFFPH